MYIIRFALSYTYSVMGEQLVKDVNVTFIFRLKAPLETSPCQDESAVASEQRRSAVKATRHQWVAFEWQACSVPRVETGPRPQPSTRAPCLLAIRTPSRRRWVSRGAPN